MSSTLSVLSSGESIFALKGRLGPQSTNSWARRVHESEMTSPDLEVALSLSFPDNVLAGHGKAKGRTNIATARGHLQKEAPDQPGRRKFHWFNFG